MNEMSEAKECIRNIQQDLARALEQAGKLYRVDSNAVDIVVSLRLALAKADLYVEAMKQ